MVACNATPARPAERSRVTYGKFNFTPCYTLSSYREFGLPVLSTILSLFLPTITVNRVKCQNARGKRALVAREFGLATVQGIIIN